MKTRKVILVLSLTLCMGLFAGCGNKKEAEEAASSEISIATQQEETQVQEPGQEETAEEVPEEDTKLDTATAIERANAGTLDEKAIVELAKKHSGAPYGEVDSVTEEGHLYIHLYDETDDGRTSTWDWYDIDPKTLKGTNFQGEEIYLPDTSGQGKWYAAPVTDFEQDGDLMLKFTFPQENVEIVLISPDEKTYMRESDAPSGQNGDLEWMDDGLTSVYRVHNPAHGVWVAEYQLGNNVDGIKVDRIQ